MVAWFMAGRVWLLVQGSASWLFDLIIDQVRAVIKNGDGKRREMKRANVTCNILTLSIEVKPLGHWCWCRRVQGFGCEPVL
jgi:hypothetical protein